MDGVGQGGSGGDAGSIVKDIIGMVTGVGLIEKIIGAIGGLFGGNDTVSQSQAQQGTAGGTTTEMYTPRQWPGYVQGEDKKKDEQAAKDLEIVEKNWALFDNANGKVGNDGKVTLFELNMISNDKSLPKEVRDAASRIANAPYLMDKLDGGPQGSQRDGSFTLADVKWLRTNIEDTARLNELTPAQTAAQATPAQTANQTPAQQARTEVTPQQQAGQTPQLFEGGPDQDGLNPYVAQSQSAMSAYLDDPAVGFEAKTNLVLTEAMQATEDEAIDVYREYQQAIAAQEDPSLSDKDKAAAEKREARLQLKLQHAMQKRQEMYQLMTNMMDMHHDMSMAAIRNMKD